VGEEAARKAAKTERELDKKQTIFTNRPALIDIDPRKAEPGEREPSVSIQNATIRNNKTEQQAGPKNKDGYGRRNRFGDRTVGVA
jgi:hypothetical protein